MYKRYANTKKRKKIIKALALTRRILLSLAEDVKEALYEPDGSGLFPGTAIWQRPWTREDREWADRAANKRALRQLKEDKFIEIRKQGNKIMIRLTNEGRIAALKDMIRVADKRSDGKLILVSFDIPEQERTVRARLRHLLKDLEFKRIQNSLWASELDIGKNIARAITDIKADKWVKIFESKMIKK